MGWPQAWTSPLAIAWRRSFSRLDVLFDLTLQGAIEDDGGAPAVDLSAGQIWWSRSLTTVRT